MHIRIGLSVALKQLMASDPLAVILVADLQPPRLAEYAVYGMWLLNTDQREYGESTLRGSARSVARRSHRKNLRSRAAQKACSALQFGACASGGAPHNNHLCLLNASPVVKAEVIFCHLR